MRVKIVVVEGKYYGSFAKEGSVRGIQEGFLGEAGLILMAALSSILNHCLQ